MIDPQARKQLLLTRIAAERSEMVADLGRLRSAASLQSMVRSAIGPGFLSDWLGGTGHKPAARRGATAGNGWLDVALSLMRRYRGIATVVTAIAPMLRRRDGNRRRSGGGGIRKLLLLAVVGGAAFAGWKFSKPDA